MLHICGPLRLEHNDELPACRLPPRAPALHGLLKWLWHWRIEVNAMLQNTSSETRSPEGEGVCVAVARSAHTQVLGDLLSVDVRYPLKGLLLSKILRAHWGFVS